MSMSLTSAGDVVRAVASGWEEYVAAVEAVPAADRDIPGPFGWSIKDVAANIMGWERELIAVLGGEPPQLAMGLDAGTYAAGETDVINAIMQARYRTASFAAVWEQALTTHAQLVAAISALDPDALVRPVADAGEIPANEDRVTVLDWIAAGTYEHYADHARDLMVIAQHAALARV